MSFPCNYIIGYNNIKFPKTMKFIPNLEYFLISDEDLKKHPRFLSIDDRYSSQRYEKLKLLIEEGGKIPPRLWPIVPQRSKAWFNIRKLGFVSGSTAARFIGLSLPIYGKLLKLSKYSIEQSNIDYYQKIKLKDKYINKIPDLKSSVFMAWGDHENNGIVSLLNAYKDITIEEWGFKRLDMASLPKSFIGNDLIKKWLPNIGASPDGVVNNFRGEKWLLEVKSPTFYLPSSKPEIGGFFHKSYVPKIKPIYISQMYLQALVWGIDKVLHLVYTVDKTYLYMLHINKDVMFSFVKLICMAHKKFETGKESSSLDRGIRSFISYSLKVTAEMEKGKITLNSVNDHSKSKKYIQTPYTTQKK